MSDFVNAAGEVGFREVLPNGYTASVVSDRLGFHVGYWYDDEPGEYARCDTREAVNEWLAEVRALPTRTDPPTPAQQKPTE